MSKTKLRSADYSINQIVKKSSYKSYASKNDMKVMLKKAVRDLHSLGFKVGHVKGFKAKHIYKLVELWQSQHKSAGTIKNYMSKFRELGKLLDNNKLIRPDNTAYNIEGRQYIPTESKAINDIDFSKCTDELIQLSMEGQLLFGLRREESMKFTLSEAIVSKNYIKLAPSWTKGGIGREVPITNQEQRDWLKRVDNSVNKGQALIDNNISYSKQLNKYVSQSKKMGLKKLHGLRHSYAQRRYKELTEYYDQNKNGWECPFNNGKKTTEMTDHEKNINIKVRNILTKELGHSRLEILDVYLGKCK